MLSMLSPYAVASIDSIWLSQVAEGLRALFGEARVRDGLLDDAPVPLHQVTAPPLPCMLLVPPPHFGYTD